MLDHILSENPQLAKLEQTVLDLERENAQAQAKISHLLQRVGEERERDLENEARAANAGRSIPRPKTPALEEQLRQADHDATVLARRLQMAVSDRSAYITEHHEQLMEQLAEARQAEARTLADAAGVALTALLNVHRIEDDGRQLVRTHAPPPEINTSDPSPHTVLWDVGVVTSASVDSQRSRGALEETLRYLQTYAQPEVTVVGDGG